MAAAALALAWAVFPGGEAYALDVDGWVKNLETSWAKNMKSGNVDALAAGWAEDAYRMHPFMGEMHGREAEKKFLQAIYDGWKDQSIKVHRYFVKGNTIAVEWTWTGTNREKGKTVNLDEFSIFEVDGNGVIKRARNYFDTAQFNKQME
jgi:steroid delta-isomerase-like uncharacterized protein